MTESNNMPNFDFSGATIVSDEELNALDGKRTESKYFRPGKHEVTVKAIEFKGPANDTSWTKVRVVLAGTGEKEISDLIMVPTRDAKYQKPGSDKPTGLPFRNLKDFVAALGLDLNASNMKDIIPQLFGNGGKALVGLHLSVDLGYEHAYVKFARQGEVSVCKIVNADGTVQLDAKGEELIFNDRDSAEAYMDQQGIKYDKFLQVLDYGKSATPNKTLSATW